MDERWRRLNELFDQLAEAEPGDRDHVLDALTDERLARRIRAMLRAHDESPHRARGVVDRAFASLADDGRRGA